MRPRFASIPILFLALLAVISQAAPVAAQSVFEMLFGGGATERSGQYLPRRATAYSDPYSSPAPQQRQSYGASSSSSSSSSSAGTGRYVAYCVRLCDGRYFPMHRHGNATSVQLCNAFCPAAKTQVFNGSAIDHATASSGARYADLDNAFVYREKIVPNCTCNGKDSFGLSRIDVAADPTLRPGDIVASGDNVKAALIAMNAAKERAAAVREATSERQALRAGSSRRAAVAPQSSEPAAEPDERPED